MIIYRTVEKDGKRTFEVSGELPVGTDRVQIAEDKDPPFGSYRLEGAKQAIEHIYSHHKNVAKTYTITALKGEKMPEADKEPLSTKVSPTDEPNPLLTCQNPECNNMFARSRGRYPKKFCSLCELAGVK